MLRLSHKKPMVRLTELMGVMPPLRAMIPDDAGRALGSSLDRTRISGGRGNMQTTDRRGRALARASCREGNENGLRRARFYFQCYGLLVEADHFLK